MLSSKHTFSLLTILCLFFLVVANYAAAQLNTTALCGNQWYCVYDVPTYGSALAAKQAFVAAVGSNPLGQDNYSEYPIGPYVNLPPFYFSESGVSVCDASGNCGSSGTGSNPGIPNGAGNYLLKGFAIVGNGLSYIGFDYGLGGGSFQVDFHVSGYPSLVGPLTEPAKGFFGVIASSTLEGLGLTADVAVDNVLWVGGPGIGPNNPLWPDQQTTGGGCGAGKVCWFWYAVAAFYGVSWLDPSGASAYTYSTLDGSNFTSIGGFPPGFAAPFDVSSGDTDFGLFKPGQTLTFPNGGVSSFTISGITLAADASSAIAFPVGVTLNSLLAQMEAIPSSLFVPPSQIQATTSDLTYNSATGNFDGTVTLTNVSNGSISGPFQILFTALTNGVTVVNSAGMYGSIYYLAPSSISSLSPGQSANVNVEFSNPSNAVIQFTPVVYAGSANIMASAVTPVLSPPTGTYTSPQMVTITDATPGAVIYYTTDGTVPSRASATFSPMNPIPVDATEIIKAYAVAPGYALSPQGVARYEIIPPYAATPIFSLASGFYTSTQMVTISDATPGATIYYTTDHTTPTTSSPVYGGTPITINSTERLQAIAVAQNYSPSTVAQSDYYISAAKPVFSNPSGTYSGPQMVTITDDTPGAVIYYTTDGTTPSRSSPSLTPGASILVSSSETVKAYAVATGYNTSPEGVATYTITP